MSSVFPANVGQIYDIKSSEDFVTEDHNIESAGLDVKLSPEISRLRLNGRTKPSLCEQEGSHARPFVAMVNSATVEAR